MKNQLMHPKEKKTLEEFTSTPRKNSLLKLKFIVEIYSYLDVTPTICFKLLGFF